MDYYNDDDDDDDVKELSVKKNVQLSYFNFMFKTILHDLIQVKNELRLNVGKIFSLKYFLSHLLSHMIWRVDLVREIVRKENFVESMIPRTLIMPQIKIY